MAFPENQETQNTENRYSPDVGRSERPSEGGRVEIESTAENQESRSQIQSENRTGRETPTDLGVSPASASVNPTVIRSDSVVQIEHILQEDLLGVYQRLDPRGQQKMKQGGEKAAAKIDQLVRTAKVTAKRVLDIIRQWLKSIPGVNKHYLEQEAKIKTDKILAMNRNKQP
jgi:hypothetical protein